MSEAPSVLQQTPDGVVIRVWVVPGASRSEIVGRHGDAVKVRVAAPPEGGRANRMVGAVFARALGADRARVVTGLTSRYKGVLVPGTTMSEVRRGLDTLGIVGMEGGP